ncbi:hypothetical protein C2845_PM13G00290 [Panicum miliaceum]|uniref:PI-PLC X domain-containing protein n=1 Tax=Panicum miliaceum TaxID=4540 RepID=A0A3L6RGS5_PANMI|nr:hypothetical protein C2845_PM13G00290 [Panicum miliaceum]
MAAPARLLLLAAAASLAATMLLPRPASALQVGDTCSSDAACGSGLHCSACGPAGDKICTRAVPIDPATHGTGLPFNNYSWLTTHNSFALAGAVSATGAAIISPTNQEDTVTAQLKNGVRGLMLDTYDFNNDVWLCHSFGGNCYNITAFQPAINVVKEIQTFLDANLSEVITIFLEDYTATGSLPKVFNASGLMKYWFPVAKMPKSGGNWPLLKDMISQNQRLICFVHADGNDGMVAGNCPNRAESLAMGSKSQSLVLMNFFTTDPSQTGVCGNNSAPLVSMLKTCHAASGNRWPNYIAVDLYMRSDGGGAPLATDVANGHMVCGCDNIAYCKANSTFRDMRDTAAAATQGIHARQQRRLKSRRRELGNGSGVSPSMELLPGTGVSVCVVALLRASRLSRDCWEEHPRPDLSVTSPVENVNSRVIGEEKEFGVEARRGTG